MMTDASTKATADHLRRDAYLLLGSRGKPLVSGVVLCAGRRSH